MDAARKRPFPIGLYLLLKEVFAPCFFSVINFAVLIVALSMGLFPLWLGAPARQAQVAGRHGLVLPVGVAMLPVQMFFLQKHLYLDGDIAQQPQRQRQGIGHDQKQPQQIEAHAQENGVARKAE